MVWAGGAGGLGQSGDGGFGGTGHLERYLGPGKWFHMNG